MLYKYLPARFAEAFVERGEVLFRTLSYFRKVEHAARGDEIEGVHVDAPDHDVSLTVARLGKTFVGRYRMLNSVEQEHVFVFCCSQTYSEDLLREFNCDRCVAIVDPAAFFLRCRTAAKRQAVLVSPGLIHRSVTYYMPHEASELAIDDPHTLPFLKHASFSAQDEYRAIFATPGGFRITRRIVLPQFTFAEEIERARTSECLLRLGNLRGIAICG